jgi:hypothetical protein
MVILIVISFFDGLKIKTRGTYRITPCNEATGMSLFAWSRGSDDARAAGSYLPFKPQTLLLPPLYSS